MNGNDLRLAGGVENAGPDIAGPDNDGPDIDGLPPSSSQLLRWSGGE